MEASAVLSPGAGRVAFGGRLLRLRSDDQLVALFRMGSDEAFGVLHDRYRQRLFAYIRQMLGGGRADAEDALQDVFVRAYAALRGDDRPVTLRAWLYRVAHNRCIDQLRRPVPPPAELLETAYPSQLHDPMARAEQREDLRRLVADVRRLPEQQRSALLMRELDGLTYAELADALGVTVPAVKSLLVRARIGLVEAGAARDAACGDIRGDLADAAARHVRCSGRARRHLHDCLACRRFSDELRATGAGLAALAPPPAALAALAGLLGFGGGAAGGGAAAGGSAAVTGSAAAGGGTALLGGAAAKVAVAACAVAVVGGGAVVHEERGRPASPAAAERAQRTPAPAARARTPYAVAPAVAAARAEPRLAGAARPRAARPPGSRATATASGATAPGADRLALDAASGGATAPAEHDLPPELGRGGGTGAPGTEPAATGPSGAGAPAGTQQAAPADRPESPVRALLAPQPTAGAGTAAGGTATGGAKGDAGAAPQDGSARGENDDARAPASAEPGAGAGDGTSGG